MGGFSTQEVNAKAIGADVDIYISRERKWISGKEEIIAWKLDVG